MSKLELDDQILNHPKFIRAVKLGGGDTVHMWLGIRAYCGQYLTDGFVPADMLDEVRGPSAPKKRDAALKILREVGLLETAEGGLQMHDFLQWSRSKSQVLADRERSRARQAKSRDPSRRDNGGGSGGVAPASTTTTTSPTASSTTTTPKPPDGGGGDSDNANTLIPCPKDLALTADQRGTHETALVPGWAIDEITTRFRAQWADGDQPRTIAQWRRSLSTAISSTWNNAAKRPKPPTNGQNHVAGQDEPLP